MARKDHEGRVRLLHKAEAGEGPAPRGVGRRGGQVGFTWVLMYSWSPSVSNDQNQSVCPRQSGHRVSPSFQSSHCPETCAGCPPAPVGPQAPLDKLKLSLSQGGATCHAQTCLRCGGGEELWLMGLGFLEAAGPVSPSIPENYLLRDSGNLRFPACPAFRRKVH